MACQAKILNNSEYQQKYRLENRIVRREKLRIWRLRNPQLVSKTKRRNNFMSKYKLTLRQVDEILKSQNGLCAICRSPVLLGGKGGAKIDHCHKTNIIRGILCSTCNTGLGHFKDSINNLCEAIKYLSLNVSNVIVVKAS